jgi:hypothetical protein
MLFFGLIGGICLFGAVGGVYAMANDIGTFQWYDVVGMSIIAAVILIPLSLAIIAGRKNPSYRWVGPGPPDTENLPPGIDAGDIETRKLLHKYAHDPMSPYDQPSTARVVRTELRSGYTAPPGGGWLKTPKELIEGDVGSVNDEDKDVHIHDLGTSWVFEAKMTREEMSGVRFQVSRDSLAFLIPTGNAWLADKGLAMDGQGRRMARIHLHDDVIPNRSWIDLWDGVVRINMPIDNLYTDDGVDARELESVIRDEPPPALPQIPEEQKNKPSIYAIRVDDHGRSFEVSISTEPQVRESFTYKVEGNDLKVEFLEVRRRSSESAVQIRAKHHKLDIRLPERVLADSTNFTLEDDTYHIFLHKA